MTYKADLLDAIWREEYAFQHVNVTSLLQKQALMNMVTR